MNNSQTTKISEILLRWLISFGATILLSISSTYAGASSLKTLSYALDNDVLVPSSSAQYYNVGLSAFYLRENAN